MKKKKIISWIVFVLVFALPIILGLTVDWVYKDRALTGCVVVLVYGTLLSLWLVYGLKHVDGSDTFKGLGPINPIQIKEKRINFEVLRAEVQIPYGIPKYLEEEHLNASKIMMLKRHVLPIIEEQEVFFSDHIGVRTITLRLNVQKKQEN